MNAYVIAVIVAVTAAPALAQSKASKAKRSAAEIQWAMTEQKNAFQACADNFRAPEGKLVMTAKVSASGAVKEVKLDRSEVEATEFGRCLKRRVTSLSFPPASADDDVTMQFLVAKS